MMRYLLYLLIVPFILFITGCSSKQNDDKTVDNKILKPAERAQSSFGLLDIDGRNAVVKYKDDNLSIDNVAQTIIIIHIFSTLAEPCRVMPPYLSDLQRQRSDDVFVLGIVVPEEISTQELRKFMLRNETTFFVSNSKDNKPLADKLANSIKLGENYPLPLTIVFVDGRIYRHYEGVVPIEMIYSDLDMINNKQKADQ